MSRQGWLLSLLAMALAGLVAYWFFDNFEEKEVEHYVGYHGEARENPLLAARRFLRAMGIPAENLTDPAAMSTSPLGPTDTLLIWTERTTLGETASQALLDWVRQGGHLIVRPVAPPWIYEEDKTDEPDATDDFLLAPLGLGARWVDEESATDDDETESYEDGEVADETAANDDEGGTCEGSDASRILVRWGGEEFLIRQDPDLRLRGMLDTDLTLSDDTGVYALQRRLGEGRLTVLVDLDFITNDTLGQYDHAAFLHWLLHWGDQRAIRVWLLNDDAMRGLPQWLWRHAKAMIIAAALLLFAWMFSSAWRFGPLIPPVPPVRKRILEHIEASGHFLWRQGQQRRLLEAVRAQLHRRMGTLHPAWSQLSPEEREQHLSQLCDLPVESVRDLLHGNDHDSPARFTQAIQSLENLRKQL